MIDFTHIETLHEQIRAFLDVQEPDWCVLEISLDGRTVYMPPLSRIGETDLLTTDFRLVDRRARFRVELCLPAARNPRLVCCIETNPVDGTLRITERTEKRR